MAATVTVQIIFAGLVALIPAADHNSARVLLPFTSESEAASDGCKLEKHYPILAVRARNCKDNGRMCKWKVGAPFKLPPTKPESLSGGWRLERQEVVFCVRDANAAVDAPCKPPSFELHGAGEEIGMFPASEAEATSSQWIAPVRDADRVSPEVFDGLDPIVEALVLVEHGDLSTCHLATIVDERAELIAEEPEGEEGSRPQMLAFRFGRIKWWPPVTWAVSRARAMADAFMVTFKIDPAQRVDILLSSLENSGNPRIVSLRPARAGGQPDSIQVWIQNIADPRMRHGDGGCYKVGYDKHFQLFHRLVGTASQVGQPHCPNRRIPTLSRFRRNVYDAKHPGLSDPVYQPNELNRCTTLDFGVPVGHGGIIRDKQVCGNGQLLPPG